MGGPLARKPVGRPVFCWPESGLVEAVRAVRGGIDRRPGVWVAGTRTVEPQANTGLVRVSGRSSEGSVPLEIALFLWARPCDFGTGRGTSEGHETIGQSQGMARGFERARGPRGRDGVRQPAAHSRLRRRPPRPGADKRTLPASAVPVGRSSSGARPSRIAPLACGGRFEGRSREARKAESCARGTKQEPAGGRRKRGEHVRGVKHTGTSHADRQGGAQG